MMHLSISQNWLFSRTAQRVYLVCTILDFALLGTRMGIAAAMNAAGVFTLPPLTSAIVRVLLFPEVLGTSVLAVGMSYCWLGIGASYKKKVLWVLFAGFFLLSMPIYYFAFYRRLASEKNRER